MRGLKGLNQLLIAGILGAAIIILYVLGGTVSKQSINVAGCSAEWDTIARTVQSAELCPVPNETCIAEPYVMQHNAVVDAVLCACQKAVPSYSDAYVNTAIVEAYNANTNATLTARDICEGGQLAKWGYHS